MQNFFYPIEYSNKPVLSNLNTSSSNPRNSSPSSSSYYSTNKPSENDNIPKPIVIKMTKTESGLFEIPVTINGVLKILFIIDSGSSEVSISPDVALTLIKTKTISDDDWLEGKYYRFADGSIAKSERFKLDQIDIGGQVLYNIAASISKSIDAPMLLGQNAISKFGKVTFDYKNNTFEIIK